MSKQLRKAFDSPFASNDESMAFDQRVRPKWHSHNYRSIRISITYANASEQGEFLLGRIVTRREKGDRFHGFDGDLDILDLLLNVKYGRYSIRGTFN